MEADMRDLSGAGHEELRRLSIQARRFRSRWLDLQVTWAKSFRASEGRVQ